MDKRKWWAHMDRETMKAGAPEWQEIVDAEPVTIPGWEYLDLCVHKVFDSRGEYYAVTEASTGTYIQLSITKAGAIEATREALDWAGREKVEAGIRTAGEQWGYAPRARKEAR